ncbi:hypothetical protein EKM05_03970 [Flavobacterium sp. GSP27]|uniref:DUF6913 domain-containing protein n=1 Tax=unclassified Flavobacterium TaxID=196869 RepID=UPI000F84A30E|nr:MULTISPECIES: hypothetical protein [unclassified Flavobacterium]RTY66693.1 hypothetical protein EKL95_11035 [Flavobacterium sp. LB2P53]RTY73168.1 hypothetical protein EKL96_12470 [Flavobacterium sp. LS1R10]RTY84922.1 hypothetical protein EKL99_02745 [Flavobacterium sp. ZB4P23]RTY88926.1 hypothetical protein EKM00_01890 [Flavobacterium sp. RSP15]RTY90742.1 hypothetical protein EKM01_09905 [Flavobacterium sp. RSP46]
MFLNYIKNFFVKKTLKNSFQNLKSNGSVAGVQTIGLVVDTTGFAETELLVKEILSYGILPENIKIIVYNDKLKQISEKKYPIFSARDLNWKGQIASTEVNAFSNEKFDLLISYYDIEKAILLQVTHNSKAQFKVGFSSIDQRLNHFMIKTEVNSYRIFSSELFKYLKLLNKI